MKPKAAQAVESFTAVIEKEVAELLALQDEFSIEQEAYS